MLTRSWRNVRGPATCACIAACRTLPRIIPAHTEGSAIVTLRALTGSDRRLRVEVEDASSALPRRREAGESGVSGRGLLLVDRLADVWGVEARGGGKCVWCEFIVPERS